MLKKCLKYEALFSGRFFLITAALSLSLSLAVRFIFWLQGFFSTALSALIMGLLISFMVVAIVFVIAIIPLIYAAQRYRRSLYSDQAYLTRTLPTKPVNFMRAQLLVNSVFVVLSGLLGSVCSIILWDKEFSVWPTTFLYNIIRNDLLSHSPNVALSPAFRFVSILCSVLLTWLIAVILLQFIYTCVSIGNLSRRHPNIGVAVSIFGIGLIEISFWLISFTTLVRFVESHVNRVYDQVRNFDTSALAWHMLYLIVIGILILMLPLIICAIVEWFICKHICTKQVNL